MVAPIYNVSPPLPDERGAAGVQDQSWVTWFQASFHYMLTPCLTTTSRALGNVSQFIESLPRVHEVLGSFPSAFKSTDDAYNPSTWRQEDQIRRVIVYYVVSLRSTGDTLNACHKIDD